ncbi:MAG: hypothetical protein ACFE0O_00660 [Opitutales bacterium]
MTPVFINSLLGLAATVAAVYAVITLVRKSTGTPRILLIAGGLLVLPVPMAIGRFIPGVSVSLITSLSYVGALLLSIGVVMTASALKPDPRD